MRVQGATDVHLNQTGIKQAHALAQALSHIKLSLVTSSDLARAVATADAVHGRQQPPQDAVPRRHDERLREMDFGHLEGHVVAPPDAEHHALYQRTLQAWASGDAHAGWPGGESLAQVAARGVEGLRALAAEAPPADGAVCVVAHGRFNKIVLAALGGDVSRCNEISQSNTCINVLDVGVDGRCEVLAVNLTAHVFEPKAGAPTDPPVGVYRWREPGEPGPPLVYDAP